MTGLRIFTLSLAASTLCAADRIEKPLVPVADPPDIRMLVPGFTVRELPLDLNNVNNLVFAPDGRLFALCYDGNVFQLRDTNGDGLEDRATKFFDNSKNEILPSIGAAWGPGLRHAEVLPDGTRPPDDGVRSRVGNRPASATQAGGLYIASQGRVIRLRDKGDGTSELETVTGGWVKPTGVAGSNLDAVGLAVDKTGNIFFGLGCDKWNDAYRANKETGKSDYDIHSERGTIVKISPDCKKREVICTGIRFSVGMAFNAAGDLFCTDQEGATWLPNGNPFDELLHIQPGRHYGFPPRHPKYLPDVIDEPSVFDYAPQHQSTCGLHFNVGKKVFGPEWWRGDAIIAGESRGKIWRTKLVKTAVGYVAQNNLIACVKWLTADAVPTPQGDLLVACHSGQPDWGTGPQGKGKLFKIFYTDKNAPAQPVLAYAASPAEIKIAFDRVLDAELFRMKGIKFAQGYRVLMPLPPPMTMGKYVTAGERFESFSPGYRVVKNQRTMPRFELPVFGKSVVANQRVVVFQTAPQLEAVNYAGTLPVSGIDVDFVADLTGVETKWQPLKGGENCSGWLPHLDLTAARGFTSASVEHEELFKLIKKRGTLTLRAQLDLWQMLHPATQPESKLDFEYPPEVVTVVFKSNSKLEVTGSATLSRITDHELRLTHQPKENQWLPLEFTLTTGNGEPQLDVSWFTAEDSRPRPLPLRRILLPWAKPYVPPALAKQIPEIEGGDWARGRKIFFGEQAPCSKCHEIHGEGGKLAPDLSNLLYRDHASVLKDIAEPSASLNPEHIAYNIELKDGSVENGVVIQNNDAEVVLGQATGKNITIPKTNVASMKASAVSLMPEGLLKALDAQQQKDLLMFLLLPPPSAPAKQTAK